ncbi:MAG: riboflavin biosynthesis protein RibF [Phycisphaerales bacterium]|nr:riboflavin biosynthesis protein RibF [Phycisphaerales bacterium]
MHITHDWHSPAARRDSSVVSIGNFDGVHRGHRRLLARAAELARRCNVPLVAVTFDPHPLVILRPESAPPQLTTLNQKLEHLAEHGVDLAVVVRATRQLLALEPREFIREVVDRFHPRHMVEGESFAFGKGRQGNPGLLKTLGAEFGFEVCIIEPVRIILAGETVDVSSSVVRELIHVGRVREAAAGLDRPYAVRGRVAPGDHRGAALGFPTANIGDIDQLIPADGVYVGTLKRDGFDAPAGISIGTNPTFRGDHRKIEAHVLDFAGDLNGKSVELRFHDWLRPQRRFPSPDDLARQIADDIQAVRDASNPCPAGPFTGNAGR